MKEYTVFLYYAPECRRNWLAYLGREHGHNATVTVRLSAETGAKAKNRAITAANRGLAGTTIVRKNFAHNLWGIAKFPELKWLYDDKVRGEIPS